MLLAFLLIPPLKPNPKPQIFLGYSKFTLPLKDPKVEIYSGRACCSKVTLPLILYLVISANIGELVFEFAYIRLVK